MNPPKFPQISLLLAVLVVCSFSVLHAAENPITIWPVDPLVKVFRDTPPPNNQAEGVIHLRAARNEYEPAQFAFRAPGALTDARVELTPLRHADGSSTIGDDAWRWNFVGFVPIEHNTPATEKTRLCTAPCSVPDPLLEKRSLDIPAGATQPVWLTVHVPQNAAPGVYHGKVDVISGDTRAVLPVELTVDPFTLPDERHLLVTHWFSPRILAKHHNVELWSEPFWEILARYAQNWAAHRQNVACVPWQLIEITREPDGKLSFDYARFDRFVELFEKAGCADGIELRHVAHFGKGGWGGSEIVLIQVSALDRATGKRVTLEFDEGLAPFLAALEKHLDRRGWLEKTMIHIADEPSINNDVSWRKASEAVHEAAPRLRRIDALEGTGFDGALEVWVPKLSHLQRWHEAYAPLMKQNEFWFYICCHPYGDFYPNRFLDGPLTGVRVLHWINFAENLQGYLHWANCHWSGDPFGPPPKRLPPGDTHVLYPGSQGPLNSIRWETQRESLEDYEYLRLLTEKTRTLQERLGRPAHWVHPDRRAKELCRRVVPGIADVENDPAKIHSTRAQIADEILALDREPLLLVETEPPAGATLVQGPIAVEIRGITRPGAKVTIDGRSVAVHDDGTFAAMKHGKPETIRIEAEHGGKQNATERRFTIRQ